MIAIVGLILIIAGTFLGWVFNPWFAYVGIGVGLACCLWGIRVRTVRKKQSEIPYHDAELDQTCELNYDPRES